MLVALSAATLPVAPIGGFEVVAAPAEAPDPSIPTAANSAAAPVPRMRARPLTGGWWWVGVSMIVVASFVGGCDVT